MNFFVTDVVDDRAFLIFTFRLLRRATGWMSQAAIDRQIRPIYGEQPSVLPLLTAGITDNKHAAPCIKMPSTRTRTSLPSSSATKC